MPSKKKNHNNGWGNTRIKRFYPGAQFGSQTIIDGPFPGKPEGRNLRWLVECRCGRQRIIPASTLYKNKSCRICSDAAIARFVDVNGESIRLSVLIKNTGLTYSTVLNRIAKTGNPSIPPPTKSKWREIYGKTLEELGKELGITKEAVRSRIKRHGTPYIKTKNNMKSP